MSRTSTDDKTRKNDNQELSSNKPLSNNKYVRKIRGELYERISSFKIFKNFFLEDFNHPSKKISSNYEMNFNKFKSEIAPYLVIEPNQAYKDYMKDIIQLKNNIENCMTSFLKKNENIDNDLSSDSESNTDPEPVEEFIERKKSLKSIEMDYVVKTIKGKKILDCFQKLGERHKVLIKNFNIENDEYYNICFEITINNEDIKKKKIFQMYKYCAWLNLLYDIMNLIFSANNTVKVAFTQMMNKIRNSYGFIEYKRKTILILVCNGNKEKFNKIEDVFNDNSMKTKYIKELINECKDKYNVYCDYYSFHYEGDEEEMKYNVSLYEKEKEEREKDRNKYMKEKEIYENTINELKNKLVQEIKYKEKEINDWKNEFAKENKKYENKIAEIKSECAKEKEKYEIQIANEREKREKETEKYENKIAEIKNECVKEKEKYEIQISNEREKREKEAEKYENKIAGIKNECAKEKEKYEIQISNERDKREKETEKYENKIAEIKNECAKEKEKYEIQISNERDKREKETEKYERKIDEMKNEINKEREKYEKKIDDAQKEVAKERDINRKCDETLLGCLNEKNNLNMRIAKLEFLLKQNNILFE